MNGLKTEALQLLNQLEQVNLRLFRMELSINKRRMRSCKNLNKYRNT